MKTFKRILLAFLIIVVLSSIGGYFYFDKKFTPPDNYLHVNGTTENVPLKWISDENSPMAAVLLPIKLKGIAQQFYMQLDFGSPVTVFYSRSLASITSKFPQQTTLKDHPGSISLHFNLEGMEISSHEFRLLEYGDTINETDQDAIHIIGTLGTDLLEKRVIVLDLRNNNCSFLEKIAGNDFADFEFNKRKILLPAKIDNKNLTLLYDSGTSAYELITSKKEWENYRIKSHAIKTDKGNSWGNELTIISAPADKELRTGKTSLPLSEVTYIEGTSMIQNLLMKFSGMQGMIGNKIFIGHRIILDCKNEKFKVE